MSRKEFSFSVVRANGDLFDLSVRIAWQSWVAVEKLSSPRADLAEFATVLRDFAEHDIKEARFATESADRRLEIIVSEYGLARKAAFGVHLSRRDVPHGTLNWPSEIRIQLPTEHGLLGEFAADTAQMVAAGSGTAVLRLLQHWPG